MLGFIGSFLLVFLLSVALGGIPFVLIIIFVEMSGNADYMRAITWGIYSIIQCTNFIAYLCGKEFEFSISFDISEIIDYIKSLFKRKDKESLIKSKNVENKSITLKTIEIIIVIGAIIFGLVKVQHSGILNLIYSNSILRVLYILGYVLTIINFINSYRSQKEYDSFFSCLGEYIFLEVVALLLALTVASTVVMIADSTNDDRGYMDTIKSWYIYDKNEFDEKRTEASFKGEYEFLKEDIEQALSTLKASHNINTKSEYDYVKSNLFSNTKFKEYGYQITDQKWKDDNTEIFYILDRKTRKGNYYKLNYQTGIFEQAAKEEWNN